MASSVKLEGVIGAGVLAHYDGKTQAQSVLSPTSFYSCNDSRLHFGPQTILRLVWECPGRTDLGSPSEQRSTDYAARGSWGGEPGLVKSLLAKPRYAGTRFPALANTKLLENA
jgi:hypothetical protein